MRTLNLLGRPNAGNTSDRQLGLRIQKPGGAWLPCPHPCRSRDLVASDCRAPAECVHVTPLRSPRRLERFCHKTFAAGAPVPSVLAVMLWTHARIRKYGERAWTCGCRGYEHHDAAADANRRALFCVEQRDSPGDPDSIEAGEIELYLAQPTSGMIAAFTVQPRGDSPGRAGTLPARRMPAHSHMCCSLW